MSDSWMFPNIPAMGGGAWFNPGTSGLGTAQNAFNSNQNYFANQANTRAIGQQTLDNLYASGGGFGNTSYGKVGGYPSFGGPAAAGTYSPGGGRSSFSGTPLGGGGSVFNTGTSGVPYLGTGGGDPFGGGGFSGRGGSPFSVGAPPINTGGGYAPFGGGGFAPPQQTFNNRFAGGGGGYNAFDPGIYSGAAQGNIGGRGISAGAQPPALTGQPADMSDPDTPSMGGSSLAFRGMGPQAGIPYSPPPGSFSPSPNYPGGSRGSMAQTMMPPAPNFNDTFSPYRGAQTPTQMQNQPAIDAVNQFSGRGTGVGADAPVTPPSPGADFNERFNIEPSAIAGAPGSFADRFAGGNYFQPGQPSEYTTQPYTNAQGRTFQPSQMPAGFSTPYNFDNPSGALGRGGFQGTQAPIMGDSGWEPGESADTLTSRDRTAPGGFYGSAFDPAQYQPASTGRGFTSGMGTIGAPEGGFNSYGLPGGGGIGMFTGGRGSPTAGMGTLGGQAGGIGSDMLRGGQDEPYAKPWHSLIPGNAGLNTPEIIKQINYTAGRGRYDPASLAGVVDTESKWNPKTNMNSYFGATQMGPKSFSEAGGRLGGMSFQQYKDAPLEQQIPVYGDWLAHYAKAPGSAAALATSDIRGLPVPMQFAIMQGTQFGPYSGLPGTTNWPGALAEGNMNAQVPPTDRRTGMPAEQATFLGPGGNSPYPTINSMNDYAYRRGW